VTWPGLWLYCGSFAAFTIAYQVIGVEPSRPADLLLAYGPATGLAVWVDADARRRRRSLCWELGAFVLFAWPIAVPAYCLWSRGRAGWRTMAGLVAAVLTPWAAGAFLWVLYSALGT
jgi:hypothetical protein